MSRKNKYKQQPIPSAIQAPAAPEKSAASFAPDPKPVSTFAPVSGPLNVKSAKPAISSEVWNDLIQKKAYELYEQRGRTPGNELADWLEAEKLVKQEM